MAFLKFVCLDCRKEFEELVFGDKKPNCPACGSQNVERAYSGKCYGGKAGASGCSGSCAGCKGCSH